MSPEVKANQAEFPYIITTNRELEHGRAWPDRFWKRARRISRPDEARDPRIAVAMQGSKQRSMGVKDLRAARRMIRPSPRNCGAMTRRTGNGVILTEDVLLINPADAAKHGIAEGDMVCVESARGKVDIKALITDEVKPGILSSTFHFPEIMLNVITSSVSDSLAMCPEYKVVSCRIRKARKTHLREAGEEPGGRVAKT